MATRACVKLLFRTVVRGKHTCPTTSYAKLLTGSNIQLSRCRTVSANIGVCRRFCTEAPAETKEEGSKYRCILKNLPFEAREDHIRTFLGDLDVLSIELGYEIDGKVNGNAAVELKSQEDLQKALQLSRSSMLERPVYIYEQDDSFEERKDPDAEATLAAIENTSFIVRVRGLKFKCDRKTITDFFGDGIQVKRIDYLYNAKGLTTGSAFVEFESMEDMQLALKKHKEHLDERYVEVLPSTDQERAMLAMPELSCFVRVTNLPFSATRRDLRDFFKDCTIPYNGMYMVLGKDMRPAGVAMIRFPSPRIAAKALEYNGKLMFGRDIVVKRWTQATQIERKDRPERDSKRGGGTRRPTFQNRGSWDVNDV